MLSLSGDLDRFFCSEFSKATIVWNWRLSGGRHGPWQFSSPARWLQPEIKYRLTAVWNEYGRIQQQPVYVRTATDAAAELGPGFIVGLLQTTSPNGWSTSTPSSEPRLLRQTCKLQLKLTMNFKCPLT